MSIRYLFFYFSLIVPAWGQGFAGLAADAEGFSLPKIGIDLSFPEDHEAHPNFKIEWWYVTANLQGENGQIYGIQWTLFRSALAPSETSDWMDQQIWMGHAALTTASEHFFAERTARGGNGQAGVTGKPFSAWIDNWEMNGQSASHDDILSQIYIKASDVDFSYALTLKADRPLILQGQNGYSLKSLNGHASYYYSQPYYKVEGTLHILDQSIKVVGQAWLDREWSSQPLSKTHSGWDWVSVHFETGEKFMGYHLREGKNNFTSGNWIKPDGTTEYLDPKNLQMIPVKKERIEGRDIPVQWRILLPSKGIDVEVNAINKQSWMKTKIPYWEGPIYVSGTKAGLGYLEMTGYD